MVRNGQITAGAAAEEQGRKRKSEDPEHAPEILRS